MSNVEVAASIFKKFSFQRKQIIIFESEAYCLFFYLKGGSDCDHSGSKPKRLQKKKVASKNENNTTKATATSASRGTTKPSISTNKRIHVTPFPESETPIRSKKVKKNEEPKKNVNDDVEEDKALTSDEPGSPSLSPFFWLRDDEERGTAETLSEPLSLDTPLRHNAPTFSDIFGSDEENHHNMTPNVSSYDHFCFSVYHLTLCAYHLSTRHAEQRRGYRNV
jgi:hypothetical protein